MPNRRIQVTRTALSLALFLLLAACGREVAPAEPPAPAPAEQQLEPLAAGDLFISEYVEGSSLDKAIEIYNGTDATVDLAAGAYAIQVYSNGAVTPNQTIALEGTVVAGDVFVVANPSAGAAIVSETDLADGGVTWNGNDAVALVKDGVFLDVIGQIGVDPGTAWGSGDTSTANATLRRNTTVCAGDPDGSDAFDPSAEWDGFAQDTFDGLGSHAADCEGAGGGDGVGDPDPEDPSPIGQCGDPATRIHAIQGAGFASPLSGQTVVIEGIVVGDFQPDDGDALDLGGFFVQEEDADADGDPATSEGIFVFAPGAPDVQIGDVVRLEGQASEFFDMTQLSNVTLLACGTAATLPTATEIAFPLASQGDLEAYEGMFVTLPQELFIAEFFNFDRFGEIVLAAPIDTSPGPSGRHYQPTSYEEPGPDSQAELQKIQLNRITLDDGRTTQNPDPARHPGGAEFDLTNRFRGGDTITNATGVLNFAFGLYRIQPTQGAEYVAANPRPLAPDPVGGNVTVANLNVLNYFVTLDAGADVCGPLGGQECRGADTAEEFTRQRDKIFAALAAMDADVVGLVEIENDAADAALNDLVSGLNDVVGAGTYAAIETGPIGSDAIRVALIYKSGSVTPVGDFAVLDTPAFLDPSGTGGDKNRPALAQTFVPTGGGQAVTVAVNHLKSKGSSCGPGDDDPDQGNCNLTRTLATQELLDWIATDPTDSGTSHVLLIGDYNAYDEEAPVDVLLSRGYDDLLEAFQGEDAYTYVFDGMLGHLDYAFASESLTSIGRVTGAAAWSINADEPDILDYDTSFKQPAQAALYEPNAFRSSDHDPVVVGLDLANRAPVCTHAEATIDRLWPANHQLIANGIAGVTDPDGDPVTVTIDGIFQDEPVNGRGDGSFRPDAVIGHGDRFELRAERDGRGNGRVYHVDFAASDGVASCTGSVQVAVPASQGRGGDAVDDGPLFDATAD